MKTLFLKVCTLLIIAVSGYGVWQFSRPVHVVAVHTTPGNRYILVQHFPVTAKGRISWWGNNKAMLRGQYNLPEVNYHGVQSVSFWDFGNGYQIEEPDRESFFPDKDTSYLLCFDDMKEKENCIRKKRLMRVAMTRDGVLLLYVDGEIYNENGEIIRK